MFYPTIWTWQSDAYGNTLANEDPQNKGTKTTIPLRFPGQYFDQETGLHYNNQRTYHPDLGRYTQSDPIGLEGGWNTFTYVDGNPLRWSDSLGLETGSGWRDPWRPGNTDLSIGVGKGKHNANAAIDKMKEGLDKLGNAEIFSLHIVKNLSRFIILTMLVELVQQIIIFVK